MVQGILLEEGIPSMTRRSAGFDVPDMLAAGRRDILVPASGLPAARDVLMQADLLPAQAGPAVERPARLLGILLGVVVFVGLVAWLGTEVLDLGHAPAQARRLRPRRLRHRAGLVADLLGRRRARPDRGLHAGRVRRRHHLLRHRQRLRPRRRRARVGRDPRRLPARLLRDRDQALLPDVRQGPRALARAGPQADRRLAGAPGDGPRRPLPVPSLRRADPARGDDAGADRGRGGRQGALDRLQRVAGGAHRGGAGAARAWRSSSPASRSTRRCGARRRPRSSRCASATASGRSCGRRWRRAC